MRLWRKKQPADPERSFEEMRRAVQWCAACRSPIAPFIYFQNGKHYCLRCSEQVYATMGLRSAGKRDDDLPYPPQDGPPSCGG